MVPCCSLSLMGGTEAAQAARLDWQLELEANEVVSRLCFWSSFCFQSVELMCYCLSLSLFIMWKFFNFFTCVI